MILIGSTTLLIMSILVLFFAKLIAKKWTWSTMNTEDLKIAGLIGIGVSCFIGFLLLGITIPIETKNIQIKDYKFIQGKYYYIVETPNELVELNDGKIINAMLKYDTPLLYKRVKLDSYGTTLSCKYFVKQRNEMEKK